MLYRLSVLMSKQIALWVVSIGWAFGEDMTPYLIPPHAEWRYLKGGVVPEGWREAGFDDRGWSTGTAGFGYGDDDDKTILKDMRDNYTSVRIRRTFEIEEGESTRTLYLYLKYDDGIIAYLNDLEVARANVQSVRGEWRVESHEASTFEEFRLDAKGGFKHGTNVLAIEGHNRSSDSSDFTLDAFLTMAPVEPPDYFITQAGAWADIAELEKRLADQSSYVWKGNFNFRADLKALRETLGRSVSIPYLSNRLQNVLAKIGDCHAGADSDLPERSQRYLPFVLADTDRGVAALKSDRNRTVLDGYPYLDAIDGRPLSDWLSRAAEYVPQGSPQYLRRHALKVVRGLEHIRHALGLPASDTVSVALRSATGMVKTSVLPVSETPMEEGRLQLGESRLFGRNIGYLRLHEMDDDAIASVKALLEQFRRTKGLIIDVRDNSGGSYALLRAIYGYFVPVDAEPYVANIAAYRLSPRFEPDHLHHRPTFREEYSGWTAAERRAIRQALTRFRPEWTPPKDKFSDWHVMVLRRTGDAEQFFYQRPVVVLSNAASFSATDGFLSAMADLPQVTLVGEPSGGGSGSAQEFTLPNSGIEVALSSMASFRPNGKLYDGNGVEVDVLIRPSLDDFLGKSDTVLQRAVQIVERKSRAVGSR